MSDGIFSYKYIFNDNHLMSANTYSTCLDPTPQVLGPYFNKNSSNHFVRSWKSVEPEEVLKVIWTLLVIATLAGL